MSPPTIRGLETEVEELSFRWVMEELSIRGEVCSCAREVSNCGERWWWGDVVRGGGGELCRGRVLGYHCNNVGQPFAATAGAEVTSKKNACGSLPIASYNVVLL
ncbi:hypothetical protein Tco_0706156 [Tanacetum coccineum]|uniref:Uncharacterized protein n=1 Tax=Tanacetum coccineum TaxID=301880 RepID=A0ABQ4Y8K6_9ASTR